MKTFEADYSKADSNGFLRIPSDPKDDSFLVVDELVKLFQSSDPGKLTLGRVREVNAVGTALVELYQENEPPFKTLVIDKEGWSYQRVCLAPGGSWLSHNSVNRRWIEIEGKVRVVLFGPNL